MVLNDRYEVVRKIGEGGAGVVYLARDSLKQGNVIALKKLNPAFASKENYLSLKNEFDSLTKLDHPNLVKIFDLEIIKESGDLFLTMEYLEGKNIKEISDSLSRNELLDLIAQVSRALDYIHRKGIVHRDIKPENILIVRDNGKLTAKLMDFGLARSVHALKNDAGGTLLYASPEVLKGKQPDGRADLYSLGILLYFIAYGKHPCPCSSLSEIIHWHLHEEPDLSDPLQGDIPPWFPELISALVRKEPEKRMKRAYQIIDLINQKSGLHLKVETKESIESYFKSTDFIGRKREFGEILKTIDTVSDTEERKKNPLPTLLLIEGESGVGKSRLLREIKNQCQLRERDVLTGNCYEGVASAYGPFLEIVKHALPLARTISRSGSTREKKLPILDQQDTIDHFLRSSEKAHLAETQREGEPEKEKLRLVDRVTEFLLGISDAFPLILFLEDLQWGDEDTLFLLEYLTRNAKGRRLLMLATIRKGEAGMGPIASFLSNIRLHPFCKKIPLGRFDRKEVMDLVSGMVGKREEIAPLAEEIFRKTDGNPFFIEEVVKNVAEDVGIEHESGWQEKVLTYQKQLAIPATIHDAIGRRIKRVDPGSLTILKYLAIINRPASSMLLMRSTSSPAIETEELLNDLVRREIIREEKNGESLCQFNHGQIREYILQEILQEERKRIHSDVAHALLKEEDHEPFLEDLAYHFVRAGEDREARLFSLKAAAKARGLYAHEKAIDHYNNALQFLPEDLFRERIDILFELAKTYLDFGAFSKTIEHYQEIEEISRLKNLDDCMASAQERLGWAYCISGDTRKGKEFSERAYKLYEKLQDREGMAKALNNSGLAHARLGQFSLALDYFLKSLALWKKLRNKYHAINLINNIGIAYFNTGKEKSAIEFLEKALAESKKYDHKKMMVASLNNLGVIYKKMNLRKQAIACYEDSLALAKEMGDKFVSAVIKINLSELYKEEMEFESTIESISEALDISEGLGDIKLQAEYSNALGDIHLIIGNFDEAIMLHEKALTLTRECGYKTQEAYSLLSLSMDDLLEGNASRAKSRLEEAGQIADGMNNKRIRFRALLKSMRVDNVLGDFPSSVRSYQSFSQLMDRKLRDVDEWCEGKILFAEALIGSGKRKAAGEALQEAMTLAEENDLKEWKWVVLYFLGLIALEEKDDSEARALLHRSREIIERISSNFTSNDLRESYLDHPERKKVFELSEKISEGECMSDTLRPGEPKAPPAQRLATLYEIVQMINSILDPGELLEELMDKTIGTVGAERGLIILLDGETGEMTVRVARNLEKETIKDASRYSRSIVKEAGAGRSILTLDAINDTRFKGSRSVSLYKIHSLMCVPLRIKERVIGTVYLDSRRSGPLFTQEDLSFVEALANHAAIAIEKAQLYAKLKKENALLKDAAQKIYRFENIIGKSEGMKRVFSMIEKVMESSLPVLIIGESGTGKELVARAIHFNGPRKNNIFLSENCSAISETLLESELFGHVRGAFTGAISDRKGLFELATHGTLFLDEIADMSVSMQSKLLRAIQEGEIRPIGSKKIIKVSPRIISASHQDLRRLIEEGKFREDLYYRLDVIQINIPPLRERKTDIPMLLEHFLEKAAIDKRVKSIGIDPEVLSLLVKHRWPGNVRELENAVNRLSLVAAGNHIDMETLRSDRDLHAILTESPAKHERVEDSTRESREKIGSLKDNEREMILTALGKSKGNKLEAARILGISRATIFRKIKEYDIR